MYMPRLATLFGFFLLLSGSQGLVLVDRAEAGCCNIYTGCSSPPGCTCWSGILYGYIELQDSESLKAGKAKIYTDKSDKVEVELTDEIRDVLQKLKDQHKKDRAFGFAVLTGKGVKLICKDFVPASDDYEPVDPTEAIKKSNDKFEKAHPPKGKGAQQ